MQKKAIALARIHVRERIQPLRPNFRLRDLINKKDHLPMGDEIRDLDIIKQNLTQQMKSIHRRFQSQRGTGLQRHI
jgi:hypothetical protein